MIGVVIALIRVSEMTFLPFVLNFFRLRLNAQERKWSMGCDAYSDIEIGYISMTTEKAKESANKSLEMTFHEDASIQEKIGKL